MNMTTHKVVKLSNDVRPASEFCQLARYMLMGKGRRADAAHHAREGRATDRVVEILEKAAVNPAILSDPSWAGDLAGFQSLAFAFLDSLKGISVFDTLLPNMKRMPLHTTVAVTVAGASGSRVDEGAFAPVTEIAFGASGQLEVQKACALVVVSNDLVRSSSGEASSLLRRELQAALSLVVDQEFLATISEGLSPVATSSGADMDSARADLAALLQAVRVGQTSKLYLIMGGNNAKALTTMGGNSDFSFSQMSPQGGTICGLPVLVADGIADDEVMLIDASRIGASGGTVTVEVAEHATLRLSTTPSGDESASSLFQKNLAAIKVLRYYAARRLTDDCVAIVDGVNYSGETV
jgi:hypothetical protein